MINIIPINWIIMDKFIHFIKWNIIFKKINLTLMKKKDIKHQITIITSELH